jgi:hypothetical protein
VASIPDVARIVADAWPAQSPKTLVKAFLANRTS